MAKASPSIEPTLNRADLFDAPDSGETFGGSYERLEIGINEVSPYLRFVKTTPIVLKNDEKPDEPGESVNCPVCEILTDEKEPTGKPLISLPISAVFRKHWDEAKVAQGDILLVKRFSDAKKKKGRGSGQIMKIYGVKITDRANAKA